MGYKLNSNLHMITKENKILLYDKKTGENAKISNDGIQIINSITDNEYIIKDEPNSKIMKFINILKKKRFIYDDIVPELTYPKLTVNEIKKGILINSLRLNITECCNLRCSYCYEKIPNNFSNQRIMSWEVAKVAIDKFLYILLINNKKECGIRFFGGEPLLNWNLMIRCLEYISCIFPNDIKIDLMINTNGTLLNKDICKALKSYKVNVILSLDGTKEFHDKNRVDINGEGSFDDVDTNINLLAREGCNINISVVCTDDNYPYLKSLVDYIDLKKEKYNIGISLSFNNIHICDREGIITLCYEDRVRYLIDAIRYAKEKNIMTHGGLTYLSFNHLIYKGSNRHCAGIGCEISIAPNGDVFPCTGVKLNLGNIKQLDDVLSSDNYIFIAQRIRGTVDECDGCNIEAYCAGGCYAEYISSDGKKPYTNRDCKLENMIFEELVKEYIL